MEFDSLGFACSYEIDWPIDLPSSGDIHRFPSGSSSDGVLLRVRPDSGEPWVGMFEFGMTRGNSVVGTPRSNQFLVLSGSAAYLCPATLALGDGPEKLSELAVGYSAFAESQLLVLDTFTDLIMIGRDWVRVVPEIAHDGIRSLRVDNDLLRGESWYPWIEKEGGWTPFAVRIQDGVVVEGECC